MEAEKNCEVAIRVNGMNSANHKTFTYRFYYENCNLTFVKQNSVTVLNTGMIQWVHLPRGMERRKLGSAPGADVASGSNSSVNVLYYTKNKTRSRGEF